VEIADGLKTKRYEQKQHNTCSAAVKTKIYKRKQCSSSSSESSEASEVEQVMTCVSDIQLRDFNPQGREEWLTRAINYLRSYPDISEATRVNLYKKIADRRSNFTRHDARHGQTREG